jgi:hypothetical protein
MCDYPANVEAIERQRLVCCLPYKNAIFSDCVLRYRTIGYMGKRAGV